MLIDWFTVLAQVINFLILVWLLKRFLYKPILNAIDAREKKIAKELADADTKKAEALKEREEFQHKNEEFEKQRAAMLGKATEDADKERSRLLDEARQAADDLSAKRQESLRRDAHNLNQAISRRAGQEVFAIARKTLTDLATTGLEERLADVFTRRLREMDGQAKKTFGESLKDPSSPALVRSAFDLPAGQRTVIQQALNETFSAEIQLRFETAPELISGIELSTNGQKLAWSIAGYLVSLENGVDELLKEQGKARAQVAKPADLTSQIGKRAYQLYEEQGHHDGRAAEDWEKAEGEIRKKSVDSAKAKPRQEYKLEAKERPEPAVKPESQTKPDDVVKSDPAIKVEAKPEPEPKPDVEAKIKVGTETVTKTDPASAAVAEPEPEASKPEPGSK
ncbi:MAG: F0F1 ATP synthase subunit delta [Gallionella sp.]